jgi:hypothetical protein
MAMNAWSIDRGSRWLQQQTADGKARIDNHIPLLA